MNSENVLTKYYAIGLMSGTSLDGLDIAYSLFTKIRDNWTFTLLKSKSISYSKELEYKLKNSTSMTALELSVLNTYYGKYLAQQVLAFIKENNISIIDVIASHGHTVFHQPDNGFTLQIGDAAWIYKETKITVVSDFRSQDIVLGGQGAPLVPIGDKLLFSEFDFRINLGGFANISYEKDDKTIAFDICPVNTILNKYANKLGLNFDDKGNISKSGKIIPNLLRKLNKIDFYYQKTPKSLGVEWNEKEMFPILKEYEDNKIEDVLHTFSHHVAKQVVSVMFGSNKKVLISGGGAYNDFLISLIKKNTSNEIIIENNDVTEFKEAIIFGFLAVLRIRNEVNCLAEVTGAVKDHSSGVIIDFLIH